MSRWWEDPSFSPEQQAHWKPGAVDDLYRRFEIMCAALKEVGMDPDMLVHFPQPWQVQNGVAYCVNRRFDDEVMRSIRKASLLALVSVQGWSSRTVCKPCRSGKLWSISGAGEPPPPEWLRCTLVPAWRVLHDPTTRCFTAREETGNE